MSAQAVRLTDVDIDNALANDHLNVVFQPVFSLSDGALSRMETFIRWDHPGLGSLPPGAFISFFEAQGRMGELTRHVLRRAVSAYTGWRGTSGPGFSVNLAQSDMTDPSFPVDLGGILGAAGMPAKLVTLECPPLPPEVGPEAAAGIFRRLSGTGCPLAIEVRGRAPDALAKLDPFPFNEIKTGGAAILRFARTAQGGPGLTAISELIDLAEAHGAATVAVGVEDAAAAAALKKLGFDAAQGHVLGAAASLDAFSAQTVNTVRATLGLEPLSQAELGELIGRDAEAASAPAPLVLEAEEPAAEPDTSDATALAIAKLKARKIAAKRAALRKAQEDKERAAAQQASDTARRLQERLAGEVAAAADAKAAENEAAAAEDAAAEDPVAAAEITPPIAPRLEEAGVLEAEDDGSAEPSVAEPAVEAAGAPEAEADAEAEAVTEDEEAGVLLAPNLAEVALGVTKRHSFEEGLRMDGYDAGIPRAAAGQPILGAVAPDAEPQVRTGLAEPAPFSSVSEAIHALLDELPVPDEDKARLRHSADKPLHEGEAEPAALTASELEADVSPDDALDAVVAASPILTEEDVEEGEARGEPEAVVAAPRRRRKSILARKYRITHFWPRSWVRAYRRMKAARAARALEAAEPAEA